MNNTEKEILKDLYSLVASHSRLATAIKSAKMGSVERALDDSKSIVRKIAEKIEYPDPMIPVKEAIEKVDFTEFAVWLDIEYGYNRLIKELDDDKRSNEILNQLIDDMD